MQQHLSRVDLPIQHEMSRIRQALQEKTAAVLVAEPGAGKTTFVPLALLDEQWLGDRKIVILEPRRLAARLAAGRMAALLSESVGDTVGYQIRKERKISSATRIEVLTEGILTRRMQADPELAEIGLVIFDEFHERTIHADLALAFCLEIMGSLRPDLRLLLMSATLDTGGLAAILGDCSVIQAKGRNFPVTVRHAPALGRHGERWNEYVFSPAQAAMDAAAGIRRALEEQQGDILAFLPGAGEIHRTAGLLNNLPEEGVVVRPLLGTQTREEQELAIFPDLRRRRRVVLATAVAETSLTIEGITTVVDCGWSRRPQFDPSTGLTRLKTIRVSRAAATQRAGRAGRLAAGYCYRLWSPQLEQALHPFHPPEIRETGLTSLVLELALWGVADPGELAWLDIPPAENIRQAKNLLLSLDCLDKTGRITAFGRQVAAIPLHPRLACLLLKGDMLGAGFLAADLAAILSEKDLLSNSPGHGNQVDIELRLQILTAWRQQERDGAARFNGDPKLCRRVDQLAAECRRYVKSSNTGADRDLGIGTLVAFAYPDRIAGIRRHCLDRYQLASGRGCCLLPDDHLCGSRFLAVAAMDAGKLEGRIYLAAELGVDAISRYHPNLVNSEEHLQWDSEKKAVSAFRQERIGKLVVSEVPLRAPAAQSKTILLDAIKKYRCPLPWSREAIHWRNKVGLLAKWLPEEHFPDLSNDFLYDTLEEWLGPYIDGVTSLDQLQQVPLDQILRNRMNWRQQQLVETEAPKQLTVPSGSQIRLHYNPDGPPVLKVRLQEMFGLVETPRICGGRLKVLLHLLSPAQRPIQVTDDLGGFWENTYPAVKKELKGRYPKHYWPDDPLTAPPTARAKPPKKKK